MTAGRHVLVHQLQKLKNGFQHVMLPWRLICLLLRDAPTSPEAALGSICSDMGLTFTRCGDSVIIQTAGLRADPARQG